MPQDFQYGNVRLADLIVALELAPSKKEAQRLMEQGGVRLDGEVVDNKFAQYEYKPGAILQVGKRKVVKLV